MIHEFIIGEVFLIVLILQVGACSSGNFWGKKMQTRYMERTNSMREKRKLEEDNQQQEHQQPERKRPALAR